MTQYIHKVKYYETDKMGITHHSNYIRWMEEARVDFLEKIGYGYKRLEDEGVVSPVVSVECHYKYPTTFDDEIRITVQIIKYTGAKVTFSYEMVNNLTSQLVLTAESTHCFVTENGRPISVRKHFPQFDEVINKALK